MPGQNYVPKQDGVDVVIIHENFNKAIESDDGIDIASYIEAFRELAKFFDLMGALFHTMSADIRDQIKILEKFHQSSEASNYNTIQSILEFESALPEVRLEPKRKDPSGSRTVLHLDRTLEFFVQFLIKMDSLHDDDHLPPSAQVAYKATLAHHHSWLLSKAAGVAIRTLPTKVHLFERVSKHPYQATVEGMKKVIVAMTKVHEKTRQFFTDKNLLGLPF